MPVNNIAIQPTTYIPKYPPIKLNKPGHQEPSPIIKMETKLKNIDDMPLTRVKRIKKARNRSKPVINIMIIVS